MNNKENTELLTEIRDLKENSDKVYTLQAAERKAFLEDPDNAEMLSEIKLGMMIAKAMYEARKSAGMTQKELAQKLHTRQSYIAEVEKGKRNITIDTLERFANACGKHIEINLA